MHECNTLVTSINKSRENPFRIKLLGDSITHGVGGSGFSQNGDAIIHGFFRNPNGYCWANLFKSYLEERYKCEIINNACSNTTIEFILENFDILVDETDDLIICMIGTNNRRQYLWETPRHTRAEHMQEFYQNILLLNQRFVAGDKKVIFIAGIPASAENEKDGDSYLRLFHMDDVCALYEKASKESGFMLIRLYSLVEDYCKKEKIIIDSLLSDGLHPNNAGHKVIFDLLMKDLSRIWKEGFVN